MQRPIGWYVRRIRSMRPVELLHRVLELATVWRLRVRHALGRADRAPLPSWQSVRFCSSDSGACLPELPWQRPASEDRAGILAGEWQALGYDWQWRDDPTVWRAAPDTGRQWPDAFFGKIPYLGGNPHGDVRVAWEPSRLQQLIALALIASDESGEESADAVELIERQLLSWVDANPTLSGIHYISVMECAQRIMAVSLALDLVRDRLRHRERVWPALLRLVQGHADLIIARMSLHSSTGNHTVTEAAGLVFAGTVFPELRNARRWREYGLEILRREAVQVLPDGGSVEQAFRYLLLVVDLYGLITRVVEHSGARIPVEISAAFERGCAFLGAFATGYEDLPAIGDSDSGFAVSRYLRLSWPDDVAIPGTKVFHEAGYTLSRDLVAGQAMRLVFDHGPFGMPPLYGHGHADALSLTLRVGDVDLLIDPGTYSYTGHPDWRKYFRGTRAHNTVTVGDEDQARQELSFMWSQARDARLLHSESDGASAYETVGRSDGYERLNVVHWRAVIYRSPGLVVVVDRLTGSGRCGAALHWHCPASLREDGEVLRFAIPDTNGEMRIEGAQVTLHTAERSPEAGWQSPVYGALEPATTVRAELKGELPLQWTTAIRIGEPDQDIGQYVERACRLLDRYAGAGGGA